MTSVGPSFSTSPGQLTLNVKVSFLSGSHSITSPEMRGADPSGVCTKNTPPTLRSNSTALRKKYFWLNSAEVNACQTFSGVETM